MARKQTVNELSNLIETLQSERQEHVDAIAAIDQTFDQFGISPETGRRRGRRPGRPRKKVSKKKAGKKKVSKKRTKRGGRRRRFTKTGEESVLSFVKQQGKPNAKEVNAHWAKEGRGGKADNTLSKLVKEGKLKRVKAKGERGSRYRAA